MTVRHSPLRVFLVVEASSSLAFALAFTLQALYFIQVAQLTPFQLLLVGTALELTCLFAEVPTGVVADLYSRRLSVILGYGCLGLSMLVVGLFPHFGAILAAQLVAGLGYTLLSGAQTAWLADEGGEAALGRTLLLGSQWGRAAALVGIPACALLALGGLGHAILAGGALLLSLAVYLALHMPERHFMPAPVQAGSGWQNLSGPFTAALRDVRRSTTLLGLLFAALLFGASSEAVDRLSEYHFLKDIGTHAPPVWFFAGLSLAGHLVGLIVTGPLLRRLNPSDERQAAPALRLVTLLGMVALAAFALAPNLSVALLAFVAADVLRGLYGPIYQTWLNQGLASRSRATVLSIAGQADALGQIAFGPLMGALGSRAGVPWALFASALLRLPMLWLFGRRRVRTAEVAEG